MLIRKLYHTTTKGGLEKWLVEEWLLFGFILIYRYKLQCEK